MKRLFKNYGLPENPEVLFMLILGILLQMTDGSPFSIKQRWEIVWNTELPAEHFSLLVQKIIKTVLSVIVVVRCATTYAYVVSAMLVIFSLLKNSAPKLMLLWLLISMVKSVCMTFLEALTGVYVCSAFGKIRKACVEFFVSKALEIIFAAYLWGSVLNIYQEMERKLEESKAFPTREQLFMQKVNMGRYRTRSLLDESTLYKTACLNYFEFKDVPQIILQMLGKEEEMSQDSLLGPGMMLASVSNLGSFDNLKTSQSLGELGFVDLKSVQVTGLEEEENLPPPDKALKFLKLTWSDVRLAQRNKTEVENDLYTVDEDTWNRLTVSGININRPKTARAEVVMREISPTEPGSIEYLGKKTHKRSFELKFGLSLFNFFREKDIELPEADDDADEEQHSITFDTENEYDEEETSPLFMSNIKEEVVVNRIRLDFVSKAFKGNTYANLYKQDYMSVIGPEVFDRASKLPKVTSITKITEQMEAKISASLPTLLEGNRRFRKKISFDNESMDKEEHIPAPDLSIDNNKDQILFSDETKAGQELSEEASTTNSDSCTIQNTSNHNMDTEKQDEKQSQGILDPQDRELSTEENKTRIENNQIPCFKKHKIRIKFLGKQIANQNVLEDFSSYNENLQNDSDECSDLPSEEQNLSEEEEMDEEKRQSPETTSLKSADNKFYDEDNSKTFSNPRNKQIYFLAELLQKPFIDVLITYYDLKSKMHVQSENMFLRNYKSENRYELFENYFLKPNETYSGQYKKNEIKVWKSKVLEIAATSEGLEVEYKPNVAEFLSEIIKKEAWLKKRLENRYNLLLSKKGSLSLLPFNEKESLKQSDCTEADVSIKKNSELSLGRGGLVLKEEQFFDLQQKLSESYEIDDFEKKSKTEIVPSRTNYTNIIDVSSEKCCNDSIKSNKNVLNNDTIENTKDKEESVELSQENIKTPDTVIEIEKQESKVFQEADSTTPEITCNLTEENFLYTQESDESFSLFYSKAADLASPLLDVKRFIYPDHIHYSFKHVKKKGFDVDITGGLPLLVRESLTGDTNLSMKNVSSNNPKLEITRRPMDLSFAMTNAFAEWQSNNQIGTDPTGMNPKKFEGKKKDGKLIDQVVREKNRKKQRSKKINQDENNSAIFKNESLKKPKPRHQNFNEIKHKYSVKDCLLIEKLLRMHMRQNESDDFEKTRTPVQISSTQLHSNKGRISSMYNPAIFLQENKTRNEKKKVETQEERTKDMFARLEREALMQNKNFGKAFASNRRI